MEGKKPVGISAPDLVLLSFIGYKEKVTPDKSVILKIRFYMKKDTNIYITARELKVREFYLMKPRQKRWPKGWQEFSPWPTKEVLQPLRLSLNDLGIVGRINRDQIGSCEIAPLIIYHSQLPTNINKYTLHLLPKEDLKRVTYRFYKSDKEESIKENQVFRIFGSVPFSITVDLSNQDKGYYKLVLDCRYRNKIGGPHRTYTFYHNPDVSPAAVE